MPILVTGGAGYIGSHTVRLLAEQNREVIVLDNLEHGHPRAVVGADLIQGDVRDAALVRRTLRERRVDAVIHFAGYKGARGVDEAPRALFR